MDVIRPLILSLVQYLQSGVLQTLRLRPATAARCLVCFPGWKSRRARKSVFLRLGGRRRAMTSLFLSGPRRSGQNVPIVAHNGGKVIEGRVEGSDQDVVVLTFLCSF